MTPYPTHDLETLHAYLDGALSPTEQAAFVAQVALDPALADALKSEQAFRARLRARVSEMRAPASLQAKVRATLASAPPATPTRWQRWLAWWKTPQPVRPLAGLAYALFWLVLFGGVVWWIGQPAHETETALNRLFEKHEMYFENQPVLDVTGPSAAITNWFVSRVPFRVPVPTLSDGWQLKGARLDEFQQQRAAHLLYIRGNGQRTSLTLFTPQAADFPEQSRIQYAGQTFFMRDNGIHRAILWRTGDSGYALIGDIQISTTDFLRLAVEARAQLP